MPPLPQPRFGRGMEKGRSTETPAFERDLGLRGSTLRFCWPNMSLWGKRVERPRAPLPLSNDGVQDITLLPPVGHQVRLRNKTLTSSMVPRVLGIWTQEKVWDSTFDGSRLPVETK